ncbi:MAG: L,D-transpeptidase family protein [Bacteroidetes bacterium]|nr:L,D-transpeptidase family protein [Bacteroidota bacterium]
MTPRAFVFLCLVSCSFFACKNDNGKSIKKLKSFTQRDQTITPENAFTDLFLDSMKLETFIQSEHLDTIDAQHIRSFYNSRNYQFAWFNKSGLNEQGLSFWNLLNSFISLSKDSFLFDKKLAKEMTEFVNVDSGLQLNKNNFTKTELKLTRQFFIYANVAYAGRVNPEELQWFIPRKKIDALALLDSMVSHNGKFSEQWEPVNAQYQALRKELIRFRNIADKGGWQPILWESKKIIQPGTEDAEIVLLKQRLFISGDLAQNDSTNLYDSTLQQAVKTAQRRFGFREDGIVNEALIKELNVPAKLRIEQILINMERMRWLPETAAANRIVANIPEFKLHVYENNKEAFSMNIVVGKEGTGTVIFNDILKYIVFSPYWNVPSSIVKKEIMPAMRRNPNYLARNNMEITGKSGGIPIIRQKPGGKNSLGRVKFLFPNNYNIYFHDTPAKSLFSREKRAFSHGCMRLSEPKKLAEYLLRDQPEWTEQRIDSAMNLHKEKWVTLKNPLPVFVSYFTAWVDSDGLLNFRDDIYGHDKKMANRMFVQSATLSNDSTVIQR